MRKLTGMGVLLVALVTVAPHAGDGRIQIWEPTTITQSGHYVVTRDITTSGQSVILIQPPATRVTLDLNGFTLTTDSSMTVISAGNAINDAHTIRNGTIVGGFNGISSTADRLTIERVTIIGPANHGMSISGAGLSIITGCRVSKAVGMGIRCNAGSCRINDNVIEDVDGRAIYANLEEVVEIRRNIISNYARDCKATFCAGIEIDGTMDDPGGRGIVQGNIVYGMENAGSVGIDVGTYADNISVIDNTISDHASVGMFINSAHNRIVGNVIGSSSAISTGVSVGGIGNLITGNKIIGPSFGLAFTSFSSDNAYGENMLRGNTTPVSNSGTNNTDMGGNVL